MVKIAIIGAGASGMMAALMAKSDENSIDLYEKSSVLGKKIAVSGNGKCNISNTNISKFDYFGNNLDFLDRGLEKFGFENFERFCNEMGLHLTKKDNGKVYPYSFESSAVVSLFKEKLIEKNVTIKLSKEIKSIKKHNQQFMIEDNEHNIMIYDKVLIASGSKAAPKLGGNSFAKDVAMSFGHNVFEYYPSLVQLETKDKNVARLAGVKIKAKVTLLSKEYKDIFVVGDVLFTKYGLSGFAILDISFFVSKMLLEHKKVHLSVDMIPDIDRVKLHSFILSTCKKNPNMSFEVMLMGWIPSKIAKTISFKLGFRDKRLRDLDMKGIGKTVFSLKDYRWEITKTHGFEYAEVCGGGIDTLEIDPKTFESKLVKNLYFSGESLDIVGRRGGFNFAFAWMSGYLVGEAMKSNQKNKKVKD